MLRKPLNKLKQSKVQSENLTKLITRVSLVNTFCSYNKLNLKQV